MFHSLLDIALNSNFVLYVCDHVCSIISCQKNSKKSYINKKRKNLYNRNLIFVLASPFDTSPLMEIYLEIQ